MIMNHTPFNFDAIEQMTELELLVAFTDLSGFTRLMQSNSSQVVAQLLNTHFELVGDLVHEAGGRVVKVMGDATLSVFPASAVDPGVRALHTVKQRSDQYFAGQGYNCPLRVALHVGPVLCGRLGPRQDKRFDILGETVNTAVTLKSYDIALTPEVFRKLEPATRQLFKKHTPPVRYIPIDSPHRD
jgi:adenylate cyclase